MDGLLIVDKPVGPSSHDVVVRVRRALGERRIGHTGTLDPAASGVLPLVLGRATRLARFLSAGSKSYDAVIRLGVATDTHDSEGVTTGPVYTGAPPSRDAIERTLDAFRGTFLQRPPLYSAKKIEGRRSYRMARAARRRAATLPVTAIGLAENMDAPAPVPVSAYALDVVDASGERVTLRVTCSPGFYVRALARDVGERLGIGAHLVALRRTRSGDATLDRALSLDSIESDPSGAASAVVPLSRMLRHLPAVRLTPGGVPRAAHGCDLGPADVEHGSGGAHGTADRHDASGRSFLRLVGPDGDLVAVATTTAGGLLHPAVVLV
jgi:tRNA pseudouridine55 synthase